MSLLRPGSKRHSRGRLPADIAQSLTRRPLLLGVIVLAIGAFLLVVGFLSTTGPPFQERYRVQVRVPADSPVLRKGQAVRVGGRLAGLISDVQSDREHGGAIVTANITKSGFRPLPADTEAYVRVHSIVYETYLELRPGDSDSDLADGDLVKGRATSGVDLLEVVQLFDKRTRENLKTTFADTGYGLAGSGPALNRGLADTPALARDLTAQLQAVTREPGALARIVAGASQTASGARGTRGDDVAGLLVSADATVGAVSDRRADLGRAIDELPPFEDRFLQTAPRAEPLLDDLAALSRDLRPTVRAVGDMLPTVDALLQQGDVLSSETDLIADAADPVLERARPVAYGLFPTLTTLGPLNRDLKTLLSRVGPYRSEYRIPGRPGLIKGSGEIAEAGKRFIDATNDAINKGKAPGAPVWRVLPVLTARPCQNAFPKPGTADRDTVVDGKCVKGTP